MVWIPTRLPFYVPYRSGQQTRYNQCYSLSLWLRKTLPLLSSPPQHNTIQYEFTATTFLLGVTDRLPSGGCYIEATLVVQLLGRDYQRSGPRNKRSMSKGTQRWLRSLSSQLIFQLPFGFQLPLIRPMKRLVQQLNKETQDHQWDCCLED